MRRGRTDLVRSEQGKFVTTYDPFQAMKLIEKIANGETLTSICGKDGLPKVTTFRRWLVNYPELSKAYYEARKLSAESLEEEALDAGRLVRASPGTAQQVRATEVLMNQLRWSASRRDPGRFGDRAPVSVVVPVQINTSLDLGQSGAKITADVDNVYKLTAKLDTGEVVDVSPEAVDKNPTDGYDKPEKISSRLVRPLTPKKGT